MKKCLNCNGDIPPTKVIDGKLRVLTSRKYCLECSPFGSKNTRTLEKAGDRKPKNNARSIEYLVDENGCHICTSHKTCGDGRYYLIQINKQRKFIHRHVFEMSYGEIPEGLMVRHTCDNDLCINVDHLELGTHKDNMNDKIERDRNPYGENSACAKLSSEDVQNIRSLLDKGLTQTEIAKLYKVSQSNISLINAGKTRSRG